MHACMHAMCFNYALKALHRDSMFSCIDRSMIYNPNTNKLRFRIARLLAGWTSVDEPDSDENPGLENDLPVSDDAESSHEV